MADITWIKMDTNIFNDEKIKLIQKTKQGDTIILIFLHLLTLAGKVNDGGAIYISPYIPYTNKELALVLNRPLKTVELALETLSKYEIIDIEEGIIYIVNWEKHQSVDGMKRVRELNNARQKKARSLRNKPLETVTSSLEKDMSRDCHVTVTQQKKNRKDIDIDTMAMEIYNYYMSLGLFSHSGLTDGMTRAIYKASEFLDVEEMKTLLERHKIVVEITQENVKPVKKRSLEDFFSHKTYGKETLIYEEYLEDGEKYEWYIRNGDNDTQARTGYKDYSKPISTIED